MKKLNKYSFGVGDRFGHQGEAQLKAFINAKEAGLNITPVWNKSNREHEIIGTSPVDVRTEADNAVKALGWDASYFVDADHINMSNVDRFIEPSDFFTIDVAGYIGKPAPAEDIESFVRNCKKHTGELNIPGIEKTFTISDDDIRKVAEQYLYAAQMAGEIYRKIEKVKGAGSFITEVSMDEVPLPQTPIELFFILKMLGDENIPVQTIAPKFSGRFNKGVNYAGNVDDFAIEFEQDVLVVNYAVKEFGLPEELKLSIHSGSDKFAIYPHIGQIIKKHNAGIHVKTAGTTWLEEIIGLSKAGGEALDFVKEIYEKALLKQEELCAPYADVIDIKAENLPSAEDVKSWSAQKMTDSLTHNNLCKDYNPDMRQLMHVGYKLAAMQIDRYFELLEKHSEIVNDCVFTNIYERHMKLLFDI
ncbi:MAG: hypothetical protein GXO47_04725 [Chlorobi bacterium]|nr:hypothetical protein [Chlorobiota bacterium]